MTTFAYFKENSTHPKKEKNLSERAYDFTYKGMKELGDLDEAFFRDHIEHFTCKESFYRGDGFEFLPGRYKGLGYEVEITKMAPYNKGSQKTPNFDNQQELFGRFSSLEIGKAFWKLLCAGELLPTEPLCVKLDPTTEAYAKQASLAVANSAAVRELRSRVDQLMTQLKGVNQIIQDRVLTPQ